MKESVAEMPHFFVLTISVSMIFCAADSIGDSKKV